MSIAAPLWLLSGLVACSGLLWSWRRYDARQQAALSQFVSAHLRVALTKSFSLARRRAKRGLLLSAIALLFIALAGPQAGYHWTQVTRRGNDIIFAVDTSRSMLTPDVKPNRLARAKLAIDDFVTHLDGDAVGLIAFAGTAFLQTPLTLDYGAFHESLSALDTHIVPRGGTNIASAIREAQAALRQRPGSDKILLLVTDGEDLEGDALTAAKAAATQDGLKIYTVGVGSANGDLIALPPDQGGGFVKDAAGNPVRSRLDETGLKAIAQATGGLYVPLGAEGQGLETIYQQALAPLVKHDLASRQQKIPTQRYQWPLAAALGMLLASALIGTRRRLASDRNPALGQPMGSKVMVPGIAALSGLMLLLPIHSAHASAASAAKAYAKGDFVAAERDFAAAAQGNPKEPALRYDAGTAAYRAGQFPEAAAAFQASLSAKPSADARRVAEQESTYYNLGNALYRAGQKTEQSTPEQTIQVWTQSVKAYEAALQLSAKDADGQFNRDLVQRKLEQLKQQQSQQNRQSQPNQSSAKSPQNQPPEQQQKSAGNQSDKPQGKEQSKDQKGGGQPQSTQVAQSNKPQPSPSSGSGASPPDRPNQSGQQVPQQTPGASQPRRDQQAATGADQHQDQTAADNPSLPGQMSREEARELLDSLKDEQRRFPVAPLARSGNHDSADEPSRDW
jgi:Ca-activated chloride channel family protein